MASNHLPEARKMVELIERVQLATGGWIEVIRQPGGQLSYCSCAAGYALYSESFDKAVTALGWLQGRI